MHTCDPSIIRVDGSYYLYYGGNCDSNIYPSCPGFFYSYFVVICILDHTFAIGNPQYLTMIGVALGSDDGMTFSRLNNGNPIVVWKGDGRKGAFD